MLPGPTVPACLTELLGAFRGCFTAPTFATFVAMVVGLVAQTGRRTVCGMLAGAGQQLSWSHHRAHRFFSHARWSLDEVGVRLAQLIAARLVGEGERVRVVIDDTLFHRVGKKVFAAAWQHDGSAKGANKIGRGNCFVVAAIVVELPFCSRPVALPVLFRLWRPAAKDSKGAKGAKGGNSKAGRNAKGGGKTKNSKAGRNSGGRSAKGGKTKKSSRYYSSGFTVSPVPVTLRFRRRWGRGGYIVWPPFGRVASWDGVEAGAPVVPSGDGLVASSPVGPGEAEGFHVFGGGSGEQAHEAAGFVGGQFDQVDVGGAGLVGACGQGGVAEGDGGLEGGRVGGGRGVGGRRGWGGGGGQGVGLGFGGGEVGHGEGG
jgi:DDE superfamily endonuclease